MWLTDLYDKYLPNATRGGKLALFKGNKTCLLSDKLTYFVKVQTLQIFVQIMQTHYNIRITLDLAHKHKSALNLLIIIYFSEVFLLMLTVFRNKYHIIRVQHVILHPITFIMFSSKG